MIFIALWREELIKPTLGFLLCEIVNSLNTSEEVVSWCFIITREFIIQIRKFSR
jgi:hypothetical protein